MFIIYTFQNYIKEEHARTDNENEAIMICHDLELRKIDYVIKEVAS